MSRASKDEKAAAALRSLGLGGVMDTRVGNALVTGLSGGERQRAGIACEILAAPGLVIVVLAHLNLVASWTWTLLCLF